MGIKDRLASMNAEALEQELHDIATAIARDQHLIGTLAAACAQGDNDACEATEEAQTRIGRANRLIRLIQAEIALREKQGDDKGLIERARDGVRDFFGGLVEEARDLRGAAKGKERKGSGRRRPARTPAEAGKPQQEALARQEGKVPQWVPLAGAGVGLGALVGLLVRFVQKGAGRG